MINDVLLDIWMLLLNNTVTHVYLQDIESGENLACRQRNQMVYNRRLHL